MLCNSGLVSGGYKEVLMMNIHDFLMWCSFIIDKRDIEIENSRKSFNKN